MSNYFNHEQKKIGDYIVDHLGTQLSTFSKYEFLKSLKLIWPALTELDLASMKTSFDKKKLDDQYLVFSTTLDSNSYCFLCQQ